MITNNKALLVLLIILNLAVLLGQVYPEGAPPFARVVNIIFLAMSLGYFFVKILSKK